jgi:hypothetical protein
LRFPRGLGKATGAANLEEALDLTPPGFLAEVSS